MIVILFIIAGMIFGAIMSVIGFRLGAKKAINELEEILKGKLK